MDYFYIFLILLLCLLSFVIGFLAGKFFDKIFQSCCSDSEDEMFDVDNLNEKLNKYMNQNPFRKTYFEKAESEYYFTDEFYDLFSKEKPHIVRGIEQFSNYVSFELGCIESESKREKLKQKIKDAILRIAEEDLEAKLSDIYAVG